MALQNLLGPINLEATQQELLAEAILWLSQISARLPRLDANGRAQVNNSEISSTVTVASGNVTNTVTNFGTTAKISDGIPSQTSNMGALHIYNNIVVS